MKQWSLHSSDGWSSLRAQLRSSLGEPNNLHVIDFRIHSRFWNRVSILHNEYKLVEDASVRLRQLIIPHANIARLHLGIVGWLNNFADFEVNLACSPDQELTMRFIAKGKSQTQLVKPVCTVAYKSARVCGTAAFVVDETCLWRMNEELKVLLDGRNALA